MICQQPGGCGLDLAPGSAHINLESCVAALKSCRVCSEPVEFIAHAGCIPTEVAKRGGKLATGKIQKVIADGISNLLSGRPHQDDTDPPNEDAGSPRGKRWKP